MSIVISILRDDFTMIAADTRITYKYPQDGIAYRDDASKLTCVGFAWIAGVGFAEFIDTFPVAIKNGGMQTTDDIEPIFNSVYKSIKEKYQEEMVDNTKVVYSFSYLDNGFLKMQLQSINPIGGHTGIRGKNLLVSFLPEYSFLMENIKIKYTNLIQNSLNMEQIIYHTACYFEEVADKNIGVSKVCDFGLTIKKSNSQIVQANIRENANVIKQAYKNGTLQQHIRIITVLSQ